MKNERVEISASNVKNYLGLDIVAFHWAKPGACGEHGGVVFITRDSKVLNTNYVYKEKGGISWVDLCEIFPTLAEFKVGLFGGEMYPPEWKDQYLGLGNYLVVKETIWDAFSELAKSELKRHEGKILYNIWADDIIKVLNDKKLA